MLLPSELAQDFWAFREAHYESRESRLVIEALDFFIKSKLAAEPQMRQRFNEAKEALRKSRVGGGTNVRYLGPEVAPGPESGR